MLSPPEAVSVYGFRHGLIELPEFYSYFNRLSIVPEPTTLALGVMGVCCVVIRTLRRR
jgi:hypothetical protein